MGKLNFRSADPDQGLIFKSEFLQRVFPLKQGDIFDADKIRKSLDDFRKLYGDYGYIDFNAEPLFDVDDAKKVINLTLQFDQQKQFFVRRIEFSGNTTTRDKVIRRELLLDEGQVFSNRLWELSLLRLNQLGYFDPIKPENADLKRNVKKGTVDIILKVKEKGKQSISFNGGVSGLAGSFVGFSYQTNNFLGLGETFTRFCPDWQHPDGYTVRIHGAVSLRPADLDGFHDFREQAGLQHGAPGRIVAGPAGGHRPGAAGKLQHGFKGLHGFSRATRCGGRLLRGSACSTAIRRRTSHRSANRRRCSSNSRSSRALRGHPP